MCELGLFESSEGRITCLKLAKRLDDTNSKNPQVKSLINKYFKHNSEKLRETPNKSGQNRIEENRIEENILGKPAKAAPPKKQKFTPPKLIEVETYAKERNRPDLAKKFFDYFTAGNWIDSKGSKVKSWKQKFITWESNNTPSQQQTEYPEFQE